MAGGVAVGVGAVSTGAAGPIARVTAWLVLVGGAALAGVFIQVGVRLLRLTVRSDPRGCTMQPGWRRPVHAGWSDVTIDDHHGSMLIQVDSVRTVADRRSWVGFDEWVSWVAGWPAARSALTANAATALARYLHERSGTRAREP